MDNGIALTANYSRISEFWAYVEAKRHRVYTFLLNCIHLPLSNILYVIVTLFLHKFSQIVVIQSHANEWWFGKVHYKCIQTKDCIA